MASCPWGLRAGVAQTGVDAGCGSFIAAAIVINTAAGTKNRPIDRSPSTQPTHSRAATTMRTIRRGTKAPQAAAEIHTDFERGFVRAEVISFADYVACGGEVGAKEKGVMRVEGKEYAVQDGDVILFRIAT